MQRHYTMSGAEDKDVRLLINQTSRVYNVENQGGP